MISTYLIFFGENPTVASAQSDTKPLKALHNEAQNNSINGYYINIENNSSINTNEKKILYFVQIQPKQRHKGETLHFSIHDHHKAFGQIPTKQSVFHSDNNLTNSTISSGKNGHPQYIVLYANVIATTLSLSRLFFDAIIHIFGNPMIRIELLSSPFVSICCVMFGGKRVHLRDTSQSINSTPLSFVSTVATKLKSIKIGAQQ